jgi:hypothetical protein
MAVTILRDNLWLCSDCTIAAVNGDTSGCSEEDAAAAETGLARLGPGLVPDFDSETKEGMHDFAGWRCDCCTTRLAGARRRFSVIGEENADVPTMVDVIESLVW